MISFFHDKVYLINSHKNTQMGFYKDNKSYIVGFPNLDNAKHVRKRTSSLSKFDINVKEHVDSHIYIADLQITKRMCINDLPSSIKEVSLEDYLTYTLANNMNIIFAIDIEESKDAFNIESVLINSPQNIDTFRRHFKFDIQ